MNGAPIEGFLNPKIIFKTHWRSNFKNCNQRQPQKFYGKQCSKGGFYFYETPLVLALTNRLKLSQLWFPKCNQEYDCEFF